MPVVNRRAPEATHVQSVVFTKSSWTKAAARRWCSEHDFITRGLDETETQYRFRQYDPDNRFRYRSVTQNLPKGITLITGFLKSSRA